LWRFLWLTYKRFNVRKVLLIVCTFGPSGLKPITKTFTTKREAVRFVNKLDLVIVDIVID